MFQNGKLDIDGAGKWQFFVFGSILFLGFSIFFPMKISLAFISWGIVFFCTITLIESENEWQKIEQVPIPGLLGTSSMSKQETKKKSIIGLQR